MTPALLPRQSGRWLPSDLPYPHQPHGMPESFKPYRHDLLRMHWNDERIILANPDILSETHVPPEIHARDAQMKEIALCVRPVTEGRKPLNCWLHGKPGVGKTATARWVLRKLDDEAGIRGVMRQNGEQGRRRRTLGTT